MEPRWAGSQYLYPTTVAGHLSPEAGYVAIYDAIQLCKRQGYVDWFLGAEGETLPLVFLDDQSA